MHPSSVFMDHPYLPRDLQLPHYVPNDRSLPEILGGFFVFMGVLIVATWMYAGRLPNMTHSPGGRLKMCWFMACAVIHTVLEGYFSVYHETFPSHQNFLAQMWKEYSKGDSRYVSAETFTVCMESITGFVDGPLSALAVYAFISNRPYRYVVQLILSLCQLYGDVLYFMTAYKEGFVHGEMYHPLYFWFYFVFLNAIWIVIPLACVVESWKKLSFAQAVTDRSDRKKVK